ncbi:hypothetical protein CUJ88_44395 (plasmid) [Paraburkholderia hospita]|nr:hypothetical protein CUJ88_44395 [Paraburkholderia hospita]
MLALGPSYLTASSPENIQARFYRCDIPSVAPRSVVDFSFLNDPLTEKDRLQACGPALCKVGTSVPVRLFGVNLGFDAALPDEQEARQLAIRLRSLGVNLVRLHALDSISSFGSENATALLTGAPFPTFNKDAISRLRNLLEQLRQQGIYADLNLHVAYQFRPSVDQTIGLNGQTAWPNQSKPFLLVDDSAIGLQARYAHDLLAALRGAGEPALALVEINNESSLVYAWMNGDLSRLLTDPFKSVLVTKWRRFAAARDVAGAAALRDFPSLNREDSSLQRSFLTFLSQADKQYITALSASIRQTSPKLLIIGTQMSFGGVANFASMADTDVLDNHFYVDHYRFPNQMWRWDDWQIGDVSNIGSGLAPLLGSAFYRSFDKPFLITEFNQPWPNRQSAEILPETSVFASMQAWSGLAFYDYTHSRDAYITSVPREFSLVGDATKLVQFGQAAWSFRTGAIQPLCATATYTTDDRLVMAATRQRITNNLATFLQQQAKARADLPLAARVAHAAGSSGPPPAWCETAVDHQIDARFDFTARQMIIDAPTIKGVTGYLTPNVEYDYQSFHVRLHDAARGFISLTLSSRDGLPVDHSRGLLLTLPGYTVTSVQTEKGLAPLDLSRRRLTLKESLSDYISSGPPQWNMLSPSTHRVVNLRSLVPPVWMERIPCTFTIRSDARNLVVYPLSSSGTRMAPLERKFVKKVEDGFEIELQSDTQSLSPWYELEAIS